MKDFIYKKLMIIYVLFMPIIDVITSYMYYHDYKVTLGLITKGLVLLLACIYLIFIDKKNWKKNFLYFVIIGIVCLINIYNSLDVIKIEFFEYFSYMFKYVYYLVMLLFFIRWYKNYEIKLVDLRVPIIIICITSLIAVVTRTTYPSYIYNYYKIGMSFWYSSANELGNILCLLFPVSIYNALHNKDGIRLDLYLIPLCGGVMLSLGTKVGLLGYFLIILAYLIIRLIYIKFLKLDMAFVIMLCLFVIPLIFIKQLPGYYNINVSIDYDSSTALLSGRDDVVDRLFEARENSSLLSKVFGRSYYGEVDDTMQIMLAEQDFIDIFIMYGYVGLILVIGTYFYVYYAFIRKYFELYKRNKKISKKYIVVMIAISLVLLVAFISGHTIMTPSVSTYLVLLIALSLNLKFNNKKNNKIVIASNNSKIKKKDYLVKVIKENEMIKNRFLMYLKTPNQKYDYIIMNNDDSKYMKTYLKNINGIHVSNEEFLYEEES